MKSSKLVIDTDNTNALINIVKKSAISIIDTVDSSKPSFSRINSSNKLSSGINTVSSNMSLIGEKMMIFSKNISNNFDSFSELESIYSNMVDSINVPTGLNEVDNIFVVKTNDVSLNKKDGESIKTNSTEETTLEKEEKEKEEKLSSILNETTNEITVDDVSNINYQKVNSINNTDDLNSKVLDDFEQTEKVVLDNITNEQTEEKALYDYKNINEINIKDIENNVTEQQELKDDYSVEKEQLDEINDESDNLQAGDKYDIESR